MIRDVFVEILSFILILTYATCILVGVIAFGAVISSVVQF